MAKLVLFLKRRLRNHHDNGNEKNYSYALAGRSFIHFFNIQVTITTWKLLMRGFIEDVNTRDDESFLFKKIEYFRIQGKENSPTCHKLTKAINERDT